MSTAPARAPYSLVSAGGSAGSRSRQEAAGDALEAAGDALEAGAAEEPLAWVLADEPAEGLGATPRAVSSAAAIVA